MIAKFGPEGRLKAVAADHGGLRVWVPPQETHRYVIGSDSAEGVSGGDYSVATVLEVDSCEQVAEYRGHYEPHEWGAICCMLAHLYNRALLAFETGCSAHGLAAAKYARLWGYPNLYLQTAINTTDRRRTKKLGWATTEKTKPLLTEKIRTAIQEKCTIRSETLIAELLTAYFDESGKIKYRGHDDCAMSYGIALYVRDDALSQGMSRVTERKPRTQTEKMWADWEAETTGRRSHEKRQRLHDGN